MKPNPRDDDLEREFLEQNIRDILQGREDQDLADSVRLAMEAEDQEGDEMTTLTAETTWTIETGNSRGIQRKRWTYLANAACVAAISFLIATNWRGHGEVIPENGNAEITPLIQDQDEIEDHNEDPGPIEVRSMADVRALGLGIQGINCAGDLVTDEVVIEICRTQPQLTHLELRRCWVTSRGMQEVKKLTNLHSLSLPWNQYIGRSGWLVIADLKKIRTLNLSVFVGQTAAMRVDGQRTPQPPKKGVEAGPFLIPAICTLPKLKHLNVSGFNMKPQNVLELTAGVATSLTTIDISFTRIKTSILAALATCENLSVIRAVGMATSDKHPLTTFVLFKKLTSLTIGASGMSSVAFEQSQLETLLNIDKLKTLEFVSVDFGPDQIMQFVGQVKWRKRGKNGIQTLRFNYCSGITDKECEDLKTMPAIKNIALISCKGLSTKGLLDLAKSRATHLDVRGSLKTIEASPVRAMLSKRPELSIHVSKTPQTLKDFEGFIEEDLGNWGIILKVQPRK